MGTTWESSTPRSTSAGIAVGSSLDAAELIALLVVIVRSIAPLIAAADIGGALKIAVLASETEDATFRVDFDNSSVATGAALTGDSRYLLTALETSQELSVYDTVNNFELMRLPTGRAPQGVALSSDGTIAYVHNFMDRSISRLDLTEMLESELPATNVLPSISVVGFSFWQQRCPARSIYFRQLEIPPPRAWRR